MQKDIWGSKKMKKKRISGLTKEERELEKEIERGEWSFVSEEESDRLRSEMIGAARSRNKDARVNLRLNPEDVTRIRQNAAG